MFFCELQEQVPDIIFTKDISQIENLINESTLIIVDDKMDIITKGKDKDLINFSSRAVIIEIVPLSS